MTSVPSNDPAVLADGRAAAAESPTRRSRGGSNRHGTRVTRRRLMSAAGLLVIVYLGLTAIWAGLGFLVTGPLANTWLATVDQNVATWLVEQRTPALDDWSRIGTILAQTGVKIIATAIIAVVMFIIWRSWRDPFLICVALILEAAVFITVTGIVRRTRPDVTQLDEVSVGTGFPSGHAAAAAAYCAIAIVIFQRTRNVWIRAITVVLAVAVPLIVGISRM